MKQSIEFELSVLKGFVGSFNKTADSAERITNAENALISIENKWEQESKVKYPPDYNPDCSECRSALDSTNSTNEKFICRYHDAEFVRHVRDNVIKDNNQ